MDIRVIVASEVRLYRDALQSVLRDVAGITLVGIAATAGEVVRVREAFRPVPTVVVIDMAMVENFSSAKTVTRVLHIGSVMVLGISEVPAAVIACSPSGILGFVSRDGTAAVLLDAIRAAARDADRIMTKVQRGGAFDGLTSREMEILRLMQQGASNKTISRHLGIRPSTVRNHVHSILAKLGVHRRGEAISLLYEYHEPPDVLTA